MSALSSLCAAAAMPKPSAVTLRGAEFPLPFPDIPTPLKEKIISLEVMGVDSGRALSLNPALRTASPASVHAVVSYLQSKGLLFKDLARVLGMCPSILTADVRAHLSPVFAFLSRDLRIPGPDIRRVVNKCPRLLTASVRDRLRPNLLFLHRLGFTDQTALAYRDPILLVASVENTLMPKLDYLASLGLSRDEAAAMVRRCPGLFTFSIEKNFKPKYEYFAQAMGGSAGELKEFPQYFAFSLEKRIKPRHVKVVAKGVKMPLAVLLKSTDAEFEELLSKGC
ncbi:transcription termination factor MTEF1, chloroplastic-like [Ananas comosus]|uniref:Transcription termination factor MTEF1, chloroplastic-like n=1 Tax=Ananas comosus TaxID=4615 RepID=A0A6P5FRE2_ANACO|nr:transcription termination factor MTEF1, chloroplastic-like [Ananas comosus]